MLKIAQMKAITRNAPFFYGVLACNAVLLAFAFREVAPLTITGGPLILLLLGYGLRIFDALRSAQAPITPEVADKHLRRVHLMTGVVVLANCLWSFALGQYGTPALRMHGLFYQAFTILL